MHVIRLLCEGLTVKNQCSGLKYRPKTNTAYCVTAQERKFDKPEGINPF